MKTGRFSEAVDKDPALFASSYYCLVNLPKIMMIHFLVSLLQLFAHHLQLFHIVRHLAQVCVCVCVRAR